jgi:hypothetical protein
MSGSEAALVILRGCYRAGPGKIPSCPVPVALKMLLQIAARNIGQLTDIEPSSPPLPRTTPGIRAG